MGYLLYFEWEKEWRIKKKVAYLPLNSAFKIIRGMFKVAF